MKKFLILLFVLVLVGCESNSKTSDDNNKISYTNKFECFTKLELTEFDLNNRQSSSNTGTSTILTKEQLEEKKNSPVAVNKTQKKIYDFDKEGKKLIKYLDVVEFEYLVDIDMVEERKYFEEACKNIAKDRYKSCTVEVNENVLTVTKTNNLDSEMNKNIKETTTLDSIKESYLDDELFTCQ